MRDFLRKIAELVEKKENFAIATLVRQGGSAPRGAGARMLVADGKIVAGTVGGGIMEELSRKESALAIEGNYSKLVNYDLTGQNAASIGMVCGGDVDILIDFIDVSDEYNRNLFSRLDSAMASNQKAWLISFLPDDSCECKGGIAKILAGSEGFLCGTQNAGERSDAGEIIRSAGRFHMFTLLENTHVLIEPLTTRGKAYIFGCGHCGYELSPVLKRIGFHITAIDDRADFANRDRFPDADEIVICSSFETIFDELDIDNSAYLVIVTRGHMHDGQVLEKSLGTSAAYIGMIGSRSKRDKLYASLKAKGFTDEDLSRVYSPIGLDIGAETPEEIAISIAGEMIKVRMELNNGK